MILQSNDIHLKISGGVAKYKEIISNIRNTNIKISVYDMVNNCKWNGGRVNDNIVLTDDIATYYMNNNIDFYYGFSNNIIFNYNDKCATELLNKNMYGVIIQNEGLRRFLRSNYPKYRLTFSITGHPTTDYLDFEKYYKNLETLYDLIVPKNSHLEYILPLIKEGTLDANKYEVMINGQCLGGCPFYNEHYNQMNALNNMYDNAKAENPSLSYLSDSLPMTDLYGMKVECNNCHDSIDKLPVLQNYLDSGITHFKLSGRDLPSSEFTKLLIKAIIALTI